jgi:uncharacterized protein YtpQ (UPF0354 family)
MIWRFSYFHQLKHNCIILFFVQIEHSDVTVIDDIMTEAGYEIQRKFRNQDFFYVKKRIHSATSLDETNKQNK